jgi:hypothetical protein
MHKDMMSAMTAHAKRINERQWKFESNMVLSVNDSGLTASTVGYREAPMDGIGSATEDRTDHGHSTISLGNSGGANMPINFGSSFWVTG